MTHHQPDPAPGAEPERGFLVAVLAQGVEEDEELGEMRELMRAAGVEPPRCVLEAPMFTDVTRKAAVARRLVPVRSVFR